MEVALWLLAILGVIGAFDTFYYHEWRARLPARVPAVAGELKLHAARDFFYALIFGSLPWVAFRGWWVLALAAVIVTEIGLTLADFIVEATERKSFGDVYPGERVTHNIMGIIYGAMTAFLIPGLWRAWQEPTSLSPAQHPVPEWLLWSLTAMAAGVLLSGCRDLYAALGLPYGNWPWPKIEDGR